MRFVRRLFYQPKHAKATGGDASIYRSLAPSLAGMALCTVCLCGTSWAWFTATAFTSVEAIQTSTYVVDVSVNDSACKKDADGSTPYEFSKAGTYSVVLAPVGTATTGYCVIEFGGDTYYTPQLATGSMTISVVPAGNQTLTITPQWGTCVHDATIKDGDAIGESLEGDGESDEPSQDVNAVSVSLEDEDASVEAAGSLPAEDKTKESAASMLSEQPSSDSSANGDSLTDQEIASTAVVDGLSQAESSSVK